MVKKGRFGLREPEEEQKHRSVGAQNAGDDRLRRKSFGARTIMRSHDADSVK